MTTHRLLLTAAAAWLLAGPAAASTYAQVVIGTSPNHSTYTQPDNRFIVGYSGFYGQGQPIQVQQYGHYPPPHHNKHYNAHRAPAHTGFQGQYYPPGLRLNGKMAPQDPYYRPPQQGVPHPPAGHRPGAAGGGLPQRQR